VTGRAACPAVEKLLASKHRTRLRGIGRRSWRRNRQLIEMRAASLGVNFVTRLPGRYGDSPPVAPRPVLRRLHFERFHFDGVALAIACYRSSQMILRLRIL
jgi:hypothetical protein